VSNDVPDCHWATLKVKVNEGRQIGDQHRHMSYWLGKNFFYFVIINLNK